MTKESQKDGLAAVLWDMDGTLVDSEKLWDIALDEAAEWLGGNLSEADRLALVGTNMTHSVSYLLELTGREVNDAELEKVAQWIRVRIDVLFAESLPWRPGARDALATVRASGVPTALVTSTERATAEVALDTIGREFFDVTVCGDEVGGHNKPHPEPYLKAARLLGVDPRRCVAVEDSPVGAESAAAAGCTVLVVRGEVAVPPGERRHPREELTGVDADVLARLIGAG